MVAEIPVGEGLRALPLRDGEIAVETAIHVGEGLCALPPCKREIADKPENGSTRRCSPTDNRAKRITKPGEEKLEMGI